MAEGPAERVQPDGTTLADTANSIFPLAPLEQVTDAQLSRYARLIYSKTGIRVSPQKKMLLSNRLRRRLRKTGIKDFDTYYRYLQGLDSSHEEWDAFFQEITTHETYLFRDENQWDWFSRVFLPQHVASLRTSRESRTLRIWSAACSTGDEVYTIACCVAATLPNLQAWNVRILGTDIASGEIERAKQAVFGQRAMRLVPESHRRFFRKGEDAETWSAKPILRNMVQFRQHNLMEPMKESPFDIVFLKNVLIYFDHESKQKALSGVCPLVRPGGLLVAGAAEGVSGIISGFQRLEPWLFHRG
ncbi:MAG: protein-glutamate O-methyltransferase CheR [Pirellulales bacterium]|nr:protein-glutamate O-methyltransferase CheR [Pirellulales bacterium]